MTNLTKLVAFIGFMAASLPVQAQETSNSSDESGTATNADLDMGQTVQGEDAVGQIYMREAHGDWQIRCIRAPEGQQDTCDMIQLLNGLADQPVAHVSMFPIPEGEQAVAGANITVPLRTLLPARLRLRVDTGEDKVYQYSFCDREGCTARVGFTTEELASFKAGASSTITIVPLETPDEHFEIQMSLKGFTAAFNALSN